MDTIHWIEITDLEDPRLEIYRDLKKSNRTRWSDRFVAEGRLVVERLLESDFAVDSVLASQSRIERIRSRLRPGMTVYTMAHDGCSQLVGFNFHAGLLAAGCRRKRLSFDTATAEADRPLTLVACPQISMPDNLGSIFRLAAAFQLDGVIVGPMSADAFSRRVIRVSMGNIFRLPIIEPDDFESELRRLAEDENFEVVGASRRTSAVGLKNFKRKLRTVLVLGNEASGLRPEWEQLCQRQVTVEMSENVDSLNVSTAAAVIFYQLSKTP